MNADRLLSYFDRCDPSGDSLAQIRKLIVSLAISGRLGTTDRVPVVTESRPIQNEDLPFSTLKAERFVRLSTVAEIRKGLTGIQKAKPGKYPLVVTAKERATTDHYDFEGEAAIVPLISSTGHGKASLHRLHYQDGRFAVGNILAAVFPHDPTVVTARFLFEYMTAFKEELLVTRMTGTANVALPVGKLAAIPVPLVSISTQTKVDELMMLCDRLEASQAEREGRRDRLVMASLHRLSQPTDPDEFKKDARFQLSNLNRLATKPEHIKELRKAILNLAVRGKLVPQDEKEGTAAELLATIQKEQAHFAVSHGCAVSKAKTIGVPPCTIPVGWAWCRLAQLFNSITDGDHLPPPQAGEGIPFLTISNITSGVLNLQASRFVPSAYYQGLKPIRRPVCGDILYSVVGATYGRPALVATDAPFCVQRHIGILKPAVAMHTGYLLGLLRSGLVYEQAKAGVTGTAQPTIPLNALRNFLVPLLACLGNPDPVGMKVYCPTGKETFDDEKTEEAPPRRDRGEAA